MQIFEIKGIKGDHVISERATSETKADWVAAFYRESGYQVTITPLTSGSV